MGSPRSGGQSFLLSHGQGKGLDGTTRAKLRRKGTLRCTIMSLTMATAG